MSGIRLGFCAGMLFSQFAVMLMPLDSDLLIVLFGAASLVVGVFAVYRIKA